MKQLRGAKVLLPIVAVIAVVLGALLAATGLVTNAQAEPGDMWTIAATAGVNGSIDPSGDVQVAEGANQTFTFSPDDHYHVAAVTVDDSPAPLDDSYTFENVDRNHTIHVTWGIDQFTITPSAGAHGSISPANAQTVNYGGSRTFTIAPDNNYHVDDVLVDGNSVGARTSYQFSEVDDDHTISATFALDQYTLKYTAGTGGTISGQASQTVSHGEDGAPVTARPDSGYRFVRWDDGDTNATRQERNVTADATFDAQFARQNYTLSYTAGTGGTITGEASQTVAYEGDGTTVTASPNNGFRFDSWSDGVATASRKETNVKSNLSVTASFVKTYTLTYVAGAGGTITGDTSQTVDSGGDGTSVTATPNVGYRFVSWSPGGSTTAGRAETDVQANLTFTATFELLTYTITPSMEPRGGGTISPNSTQSVSHGGSRIFTITPANDFYLADVLVDGVSVGRVKSYPFTNVTEPHTIRAVFAYGGDTSIAPFSAKQTTVDWGRSTLLTGWLYDTSGAQKRGMGGESVGLLSAPSIDGPWTSLATLTTSPDAGSVGMVTRLVKLTRPTYFWLRYDPPEDSELAGSDSNYLKVNVRPVLGTPQVPLSVKAKKSVTVYGSLKPKFTAGQKIVKVKMYRYKYGRWAYVRANWATNYDSGSYTQYRVKFTISTKGKYRFRAVTATWADDTTSLSRTMTVK